MSASIFWPHWTYKITEQRVRGWYINSPVVNICQVIAVFLTFKIDLFSFFFFFFLQKASKKQFICYSIAVKNACFCRVSECIVAPSIHALTARVATALLMWGVSFVFSSPHVELFHAGHVTHITTFKHQKVDEKLVTEANNFLIAALIRLL